MDDAAELERTYRREATRIRAALAARIGDVGLAEEAVQDAFVEALEHWRAEGMPPSPGGWLATTAWRKAVDRLRRDRTGQEKLTLLAAAQPPAVQDASPGMPGGWGSRDDADELLSLIFACCHPSLPRDSQIALTLRVVCGLTTAEISAASWPASRPWGSGCRGRARRCGMPARRCASQNPTSSAAGSR